MRAYYCRIGTVSSVTGAMNVRRGGRSRLIERVGGGNMEWMMGWAL